MHQRILLVGLGNPDTNYAGTRHNLGRDVLRAVAADGTAPAGAAFFYPPTFMNESGLAVAARLHYLQLGPDRLVVVHDDLELPLGEVRLETGGSARGHNGVRSVQEALDTTNFHRLRLGIGRPPEGVAAREYVLSRFTADEQAAVAALTQRVREELNTFVTRDS